MLLLSKTDDMVVFLQSTYSQAAYALRGIAPVNEHCVREPHTVTFLHLSRAFMCMLLLCCVTSQMRRFALGGSQGT